MTLGQKHKICSAIAIRRGIKDSEIVSIGSEKIHRVGPILLSRSTIYQGQKIKENIYMRLWHYGWSWGFFCSSLWL